MSDKVVVESMVAHTVGFQMPNSMIKKEWNKKGAKLSFDRDELIEAYYMPGIEYMFTHGMLYTDDMDFKKTVGLEPEDAEEPVNVIKLDQNLIKRMVGPMPVAEFEEMMKKLSTDQRAEVVGYIIDNAADFRMDKVDIINKACNVNILKALELSKAEKEE